jgi:hypothetical protein
MKAVKNNRTKFITFRLTPEEYTLITNRCKTTTARKISIYMRSIVLDGKVTILSRDASLDAFMTELIKLRKELSAIGNNYNQAVKKLNGYSNYPDVKLWLLFHEKDHVMFSRKVEEIKSAINQFAESW